VRGRFLLFAGGVPLYRKIFADIAASGYEGFELRQADYNGRWESFHARAR